MNAMSFNKLVVEAYNKEGLKAEVKNGFAHLSQKIKSKGLTVLTDAYITVGNQTVLVPKGSIAYIKEEVLYTAAWATKPQESDVLKGSFFVVDLNYVDYVVTPNNKQDIDF